MGKKQKWQKVDFNCNFNIANNTPTSLENNAVSNDQIQDLRTILPKATLATRCEEMLREMDENKGPFVAELSNVSYDAEEESIHHLLKSMNIKDLFKNKLGRGRWVVEFDNLNDLKKVVELNSTQFIGRTLNVAVLNGDEFLTAKKSKDFNRGRSDGSWNRGSNIINDDKPWARGTRTGDHGVDNSEKKEWTRGSRQVTHDDSNSTKDWSRGNKKFHEMSDETGWARGTKNQSEDIDESRVNKPWNRAAKIQQEVIDEPRENKSWSRGTKMQPEETQESQVNKPWNRTNNKPQQPESSLPWTRNNKSPANDSDKTSENVPKPELSWRRQK